MDKSKMPTPGKPASKEEQAAAEKAQADAQNAATGKPLDETKEESGKKGIEVTAIADGYFKGSRKAPGNVFMIDSIEEYGTWMRANNEKDEKAAQAFLKEKKASLSKGVVADE